MRQFDTGATRDSDEGKYDYEGFLHPLVIKEFGRYMHKHRQQADGQPRASDNWQKGMPKETYMKSGWRHFHDWWMEHRGFASREGIKDAICALIFNACGYLLTILLEEQDESYQSTEKEAMSHNVNAPSFFVAGDRPVFYEVNREDS